MFGSLFLISPCKNTFCGVMIILVNSRTKRADLHQICNRSVLTKTDQPQTTLSSEESVFSLLQTLSLNTLRDVNTADAKQTNKRSADYLQRLQTICNSLKPKKRYNVGELLTTHLLFDT